MPVDLRELAEPRRRRRAGCVAPDREITLADDRARVPVLGDPDQLRQLLANLMRNAIIHTPPGSPIELRAARGTRARALCSRSATTARGCPGGPGERVFERFWRTEGGRSRGRGGAGLGLAIVRAIVIAHARRVTAANAPGGGAVFRVELPLPNRVRPAPILTPRSSSQESLSVLTEDSYPRSRTVSSR